jgi:epoxyqueuosine reductase
VSLLAAQEILCLTQEAGFQAAAVKNLALILSDIREYTPPVIQNELGKILKNVLKDFPLPLTDCSLAACALSCHTAEKADLSVTDDPHALIAFFARRHYYREAVARIQHIISKLSKKTGDGKNTFRIFCNSRLPEKLLAAFCGLGFYGKNSLLISPELGSRFIIALILLPFRIAQERQSIQPALPGLECAACRLCREACPSGALEMPGRLENGRCLQKLSTELSLFPDQVKKIWGFRLYGCDSCQNVCPFNNGLTRTTITECGVLGPSLSIARLLSLSPEELKKRFKKTALALSWINPLALQRNLLLAAGNRKNAVLIPHIKPFLEHKNEVIREAAHWAFKMII